MTVLVCLLLLMIGGILGVGVMCVVIAGRAEDESMEELAARLSRSPDGKRSYRIVPVTDVSRGGAA